MCDCSSGYWCSGGCDGAFTDISATNFFTADCAGATADAATCALTQVGGFGGSVTCTASAGFTYVAVVGTACTTVDNQAAGATLACTSSSTSRLTAGAAGKCETDYTLDTTGDADVCTAPCDDDSFSNNAAVNYFTAVCTGKTTAGDSCVLTSNGGFGGSVTCSVGDDSVAIYATIAGTPCTGVSGAAANAVVSCNSTSDSRVSACDRDTPLKTRTSGGADTCTTCAIGTWNNAGTCTPCTAVVGAAADATYACTSLVNSRVSACDSETPHKTVGATVNVADTCTVKEEEFTFVSDSLSGGVRQTTVGRITTAMMLLTSIVFCFFGE